MTAIINSETFSEAKGRNKMDKSFANLSRKIMLENKETILGIKAITHLNRGALWISIKPHPQPCTPGTTF